jgi:hypothetical protein
MNFKVGDAVRLTDLYANMSIHFLKQKECLDGVIDGEDGKYIIFYSPVWDSQKIGHAAFRDSEKAATKSPHGHWYVFEKDFIPLGDLKKLEDFM